MIIVITFVVTLVGKAEAIMANLKLRKIGNSYGVILPKEMLDRLKIKEGDTVYAHDIPDGVQITAADPDFEAGMAAFERTNRKFRNAFRELAK
jgi:putative addiction module antidote